MIIKTLQNIQPRIDSLQKLCDGLQTEANALDTLDWPKPEAHWIQQKASRFVQKIKVNLLIHLSTVHVFTGCVRSPEVTAGRRQTGRRLFRYRAAFERIGTEHRQQRKTCSTE
jgi:hypothetical protein